MSQAHLVDVSADSRAQKNWNIGQRDHALQGLCMCWAKRLTFVVSVKAAGVKYDRSVGSKISTGISVPKIAVDQARLDFPSIYLHRSQQSWNYFVDKSFP